MKTNPVPGTDHLVQPCYPHLGGPFQPLLWMPEHSGNRTAFCSRNVDRSPEFHMDSPPKFNVPADIYTLMGHDDNGCPRCAPFHGAVNGNCGTHYFILPIKRTLTDAELSNIGQAVADTLGKPHGHYDDPVRSLRSDRIEAIRQVLQARDII